MNRRNTTLGDQVIVHLGMFCADELGLRAEINDIVAPLGAGSWDRQPVIAQLWALIQEHDPEPSADIADYLTGAALGAVAKSAVTVDQ